MQITIQGQTSVSLIKIGKALDVDFGKMPSNSIEHVVAYGIRQILNDAMASGKTDEERLGMAQKRLDNLMSGTLRAGGVREGNPVRKRALELAEASVRKNAKFNEWLTANKLKVSDKAAREQIAAQAKKAVDAEGSKFMAQAKIDVEAAKGIGEIELDL